jgi:hypothetical protein
MGGRFHTLPRRTYLIAPKSVEALIDIWQFYIVEIAKVPQGRAAEP